MPGIMSSGSIIPPGPMPPGSIIEPLRIIGQPPSRPIWPWPPPIGPWYPRCHPSYPEARPTASPEKKITATVNTTPTVMGEIAFQVTMDAINGKFAGGFVETPTTIVDKDNVKDFIK